MDEAVAATPSKEKHSRFGSVTTLFFSKLKGDKKQKKKRKRPKNGKTGKAAKAKRKGVVFGVEPTMLDSARCAEYECPIPVVLSKLKEELFLSDGHLVEGIFRVAPNATECSRIEEAVDEGKADHIDWETVGGPLIANLIKIWFRMLPEPLLQVRPTPTPSERLANTQHIHCSQRSRCSEGSRKCRQRRAWRTRRAW